MTNQITIQVSPNKTHISGLDRMKKGYLANTFTTMFPNYWFVSSYKNGGWDGKIRFHSIKGDDFVIPTGLLGTMIDELKKLECSYKIVNPYALNDNVNFEDVKLKDIELRQDQIDTLYEMHRYGRGIIKGVTSSGKTEIAIAFAKWYLDTHNGIVLFLTHRKAIFDQVWKERLKERLDLEIIDCNFPLTHMYYNSDTTNIFLAMTQTLSKRLSVSKETWFKDVGLVFCDECHAVETYQRKANGKKVHILSQLENCYHRFGMSATPFKKEGTYHWFQTMSQFGSVIPIEYEHKVDVQVTMLPVEYATQSRNYPEAKEQTMNSPEKMAYIRDIIEKHADRKILIFVRQVEHGHLLSQVLKLPFIFGESKPDIRSEVCDQFQGIHPDLTEINVMIVSSIYYFGVNIPEIDLIVFAHIEKSYINVVQAVGRGMREKEGKKELLVYDFYENDASYLERHSKLRLEYYKTMKYEVNDDNI